MNFSDCAARPRRCARLARPSPELVLRRGSAILLARASRSRMGTITIRRLDDAVIEAIKRRAAEAGRSMEEEARRTLQKAFGETERARLRAEAVAHIRDLHARGLLPKGGGVDSVDLIREMREERERQLAEAIEGRRGADR